MRNKILIAIAILCGVVALLAGNPQKKNAIDNEKEFYQTHTLNFIKPINLAKMIIENKSNLKIFDLRNEKEYGKLFIPGSINTKSIDLSSLKTQETIVLIGNDNQIKIEYYHLYSNGFFGVFALENGIDGWEKHILKPSLHDNATPEEMAKFKEIYFISLHFGGNPQGYQEIAPVVSQPSAASTLKAGGSAPMKKKAGGGGC